MTRPNVLWIFFDELRADALGCYGHPQVHMATPAIDEVAAAGVVFDECYVNSPVCVPSRTSMLTGLHPERTGVYHNEAYAEGYPAPAGLVTAPEVVAAHGYATASFGKEHVPRTLTPWQVDDARGAGMRAPLAGCTPDELRLLRSEDEGPVVAGVYPNGRRYPPAEVTSNAVSWLEGAREPFLCRASYLQPHTPVIAPAAFAERYQPSSFRPATSLPGLSAFERRFGDIGGGLRMAGDDVRRAAACYYGLVSWLDTQVGELLAVLRRRRIEDRTVIVITSDHGAHLGEGGAFGKHTFAPHVQRVPFIVADPRGRGAGRRGDVAQLLDFGRTLCGLVDVEPPPAFEGRDLFRDPEPDAIFSTIGYGARQSRAFPNRDVGAYLRGRGWPRRACVRTRNHRLDMNVRIDGEPAGTPEEEDVFLADRADDAAETVNRAQDRMFAGVAGELRARLLAHLEGAVETPDEMVYGAFDGELRRMRAGRSGLA